MHAQWYNDPVEIAKIVPSHGLHGFNKLVSERRRAGYRRGERLLELTVLGEWSLDSVGNLWKIHSPTPKQHALIPAVLSMTEYTAWCESTGYSPGCSSLSGGIPSHGEVCAVCGEAWKLSTAHAAVLKHEHKVIFLDGFVGMPLTSVAAVLTTARVSFFLQPGSLFNVKYSTSTNARGLQKNEGWCAEEHVIEEGDSALFNSYSFLHHHCNKERETAAAEKFFRAVFAEAGFQAVELQAIANEYLGADATVPWYLAETEVGQIKIGWLKRVTHIGWGEEGEEIRARNILGGWDVNLSRLFRKEEVTQGPGFIHAWSREKVVEYLGKIRNARVAHKHELQTA